VSYAWSEMRLLTGSRWLFLLEGLITLVVGLASFFLMPASAVQTKTWFRPNGWFTDRETAIVVNRVPRDDPSKGDMHNRQAITPRRLWHALQDYDLWPVSKTLYPSQLKSNVSSSIYSVFWYSFPFLHQRHTSLLHSSRSVSAR
jgi:hypothetical protein